MIHNISVFNVFWSRNATLAQLFFFLLFTDLNFWKVVFFLLFKKNKL